MIRIFFLGLMSLFLATAAFSDTEYVQVSSQNQATYTPRGYCADFYNPVGRCTDVFPGTTPYFWRYVPHHGYRKFTPIGALQQDWFDYRYFFRDDFEDTGRGGLRHSSRFHPSSHATPVH